MRVGLSSGRRVWRGKVPQPKLRRVWRGKGSAKALSLWGVGHGVSGAFTVLPPGPTSVRRGCFLPCRMGVGTPPAGLAGSTQMAAGVHFLLAECQARDTASLSSPCESPDGGQSPSLGVRTSLCFQF